MTFSLSHIDWSRGLPLNAANSKVLSRSVGHLATFFGTRRASLGAALAMVVCVLRAFGAANVANLSAKGAKVV